MAARRSDISTVEDALDVITELRRLTSSALESYREVFRAQLTGARPSENQLRSYLSHIEQALEGLSKTQTLVDGTRELRAQLAKAPPRGSVQ
jgi:hypothetical protein